MTNRYVVSYSLLIGITKTAKNSAVLLVPFLVAVLIGIPQEYAWITGPAIYMLNNWYKNK